MPTRINKTILLFWPGNHGSALLFTPEATQRETSIESEVLQKLKVTGLTVMAVIGIASGCASNPDKLDAAYVSPLKYKDYDCDQLAMEMEHVGHRTTTLYQRLKKERNADNWQMGIGLVLFWPTLFFLEGGDGPEAAEYAQLKGDFESLRINSVERKCGIEALSPEEVLKREDAKDKQEGDESEEVESQEAESQEVESEDSI